MQQSRAEGEKPDTVQLREFRCLDNKRKLALKWKSGCSCFFFFLSVLCFRGTARWNWLEAISPRAVWYHTCFFCLQEVLAADSWSNLALLLKHSSSVSCRIRTCLCWPSGGYVVVVFILVVVVGDIVLKHCLIPLRPQPLWPFAASRTCLAFTSAALSETCWTRTVRRRPWCRGFHTSAKGGAVGDGASTPTFLWAISSYPKW